jgi:hypothetical protein
VNSKKFHDVLFLVWSGLRRKEDRIAMERISMQNSKEGGEAK